MYVCITFAVGAIQATQFGKVQFYKELSVEPPRIPETLGKMYTEDFAAK